MAGGDTNTTYAGVIIGAGSVTILGTGNFTLSGANTYSGPILAQNVYNTNHSILALNNPTGARRAGQRRPATAATG